MPENKNNNLDSKKEEDIEKLDFGDDEIELKIDDISIDDGNIDLKIDPSNTKTEDSLAPTSNGDVSPSEVNNQGDNTSVDTGNDNPTTSSVSPDSENTPNDDSVDEAKNDLNNTDNSSNDDTSPSTENDNLPQSNENKEEDKNKKQDQKNKDNQENLNQKEKNQNKPNDQNEKKNQNENNQKNGDNNTRDNQNNKKDNNSNQRKNEGNNSPSNNNKDKPKSGLDKKRDDLKNKNNNKPKMPKNGANPPGNIGKNLGNNLKNRAANSLNNSKAGKAANKAANTARKAKKAADGAKKAATAAKGVISFLSTPAGWITLAVILGLLLILILIIIVPTMFASGSPGVGGDVEDDENYSKYSEVDQATIEKLKDINEKYPNGDPALAMAAVVYPYMEELQDGNVNSLRGRTNNEQQDEDDGEADDTTDDTEDLDDNQNDTTEDDPYLELFRKWRYRRKFKKLLKETENGEESFTTYLRNTYFDDDKGYKELFDGCDDEEQLKDAIINNLLDIKADFEGYFFEVCVTSTSFESAGSVTVNEILYSPIYVDVKMPGCGDLSSCSESYYDTPITLEKYVKGVVYEELGSSDNLEQIKAQMVAAKSYAISRHLNNVGVMDDGSHVIQILWSTRDQDYCDYETGCMDAQEDYGYNSPDDSLYKHYANRGPASADKIALYDQAWEETKDYYIIDSNNVTRGSYMNTCEKGKCMAQSELETITDMDYQSILAYFYTDYSFATIEGDHATALVGSSTEYCGENVSGGIPDSEFKFYYQTDYPDVAFCGLDSVSGCTDEGGQNTICTSGCGVTSYAMVVATLSDTESTFDPIAANDEATASGTCSSNGTSNGLFTNIANNHSGFTIEQLPVTKEGANQVLSVLQNGGVVVANVQEPSPFTDGGHWIVIRGITSDGSIKVADPNSQSISTSEAYDINDFIDKNWLVDKNGTTHSWFAIYGPRSEEFKYVAEAGVATGTLGYPVEGVTGCDASDYPYYSDGDYHGGTDINSGVGASEGMNILAADGGTVKTVKNLNYSYGSHVIIDHGNGYTTLYAHMQNGSITVKEGDLVSKGQIIGKLGSTGNSTGPHLHIELRINNKHNNTLNPCEYIGQNKSYVGN